MRKIAFLILLIAFGFSFTGCEVPPDATFRVIYYGNGATSGFPHNDSTQYKFGMEALVLDENTLKKTGYTFQDWNTRANGSGSSYEAGDRIIVIGPVFLYAVWVE